ncbi:MAG: hypothetical protein KDA37_10310, partial [Planctomycetales bacterium]|nr:hypothetical protein [Planctomycetales bacterium]
VAFMHDMLGYVHSTQLSQEAIHAPTTESIQQGAGEWGFYSVQAELRMQGPLGLQTFNSMGALDWLASLPDVDPERLAVTGGSSGATQTLMLCAVDNRPRVAFPVVMVSTAMQGGCPCENACCLRMGGVSNVEFAALMAPKPLGIASANDWTHDFAEDGYPELQKLYRMLGAGDHLMHASFIQYPHNYNQASRHAMYPWLARWLDLPADTPLTEREFEPLSQTEMTVWDADHPAPSGGRRHEVALMQAMDKQSRGLIESLTPRDATSLHEFRRVIGGAFEVLLDKRNLDAGQVAIEIKSREPQDGYRVEKALVKRGDGQPVLDAALLRPEVTRGAVLWLSQQGTKGLFDPSGTPRSQVLRLLDAGIAVLGVDLLAQPQPTGFQAPAVPGMRPVASLTYGYNPTLVASRVGDATAALVALRGHTGGVRVGVVGAAGAASYTTGLAAVERDRIDAVLIDTQGFRFDRLASWRDPDFVPGAVKYGDLPGLLALYSPRPLVVANETPKRLGLTIAAYSVDKQQDQLQALAGAGGFDSGIGELIQALTQ